MENKFLGNIIIKGKILCKTGLHIGGSKDTYEIGGLDNPVIKTVNGVPYIPGSSLKGKMRSLLEWSTGKVSSKGTVHNCKKPECEVCRIFGVASDDSKDGSENARTTGPSRLVVRDAYLTEESLKLLKELGIQGYTEIKQETAIDRSTGKALGGSLRPVERVPEGSEFNFSMVYSVYQLAEETSPQDPKFIRNVFEVMRMLEDSYLGGMGTRGSGHIEFKDIEISFRSDSYYKASSPSEDRIATIPKLSGIDIDEVIRNIEQVI